MVLLDPSYEIKTDYGRVVAAVQDGWERFRTGVYVIWYPVVDRKRIDIMERSLSTSGINNILLLELGVSGDAGAGMIASGVIVINPPWKLQENMADSLLFLATLLGGKEQGRYRLATLAG
jgi:23S rRNA (adenine2030-N6)-methyltransferase